MIIEKVVDTMKPFQSRITTGDLFSVYGTVGFLDYTFRRRIKMDAPIDEALLRRAVERTAMRYPYFCVRLCLNAEGFYYEENSAPVAVLHTADRIRLASAETNYHVWAICFHGDELFIDFFHGLADGIGVSALTETLLYEYLSARYGDVDPAGIRRLGDPIDPSEYADPMDALPDMPIPDTGAASSAAQVYDLIRDGGMTPGAELVSDVIVPESAFLRFTSASDASPGTMVALLTAKAIDKCDAGRSSPIVGHYAMNARPVLKAPNGYHNCLSAINLPYSDRIKALPFQTQCTAYRGMTFLQSDADRVRPGLELSSALFRNAAAISDLDARREAFRQMLVASCVNYSYVVSYTGQCKRPSLARHVLELWTHAPCAIPFEVEIKSISGNLYLSIHQTFQEDQYVRAFLQQLEENGIPYTFVKTAENDIPHFPMPEISGFGL